MCANHLSSEECGVNIRAGRKQGCQEITLLYVDQPLDVQKLHYYIQTNRQMSIVYIIIYRPTVRCLEFILLFIDQPSDVQRLHYYTQTTRQMTRDYINMYRPTVRCLEITLLWIDQPSNVFISYYMQTNRQMSPLLI